MKTRWMGACLAIALAVGCSGRSDAPDDLGAAGMAGAAAGEESAPEPRGGGAGGREGDVDEPGGAGAIEADEIAGHGFTLSASLCPEYLDDQTFEASDGGNGLSSFFVREAAKGGLELVTYSRAGGAPVIEVHMLEQEGERWVAHDVVTCVWLYGYEDYWTEAYSSKSVELSFAREADGSQLEANVTATLPEGKAVSAAIADTAGPTLSEFAEAKPMRGLVDDYGSRNFSHYFVFSEPVVEHAVAVRDRHGEPVEISEYLSTEGLVWGFVVRDELDDTATISGRAEDASGNVGSLSQPYPGITGAVQVGTFESDVAFVSSDLWVGQGAFSCQEGGVSAKPANGGEVVDVPPLEGQSSLFVPIDCSLFFRVQRAEGAERLTFDSRLLGYANEGGSGAASISVCVSSLAAGNDQACSTVTPEWHVDATHSDERVSVTLPSNVGFSLPAAGDDLWVEVSATRALWLDSLRTE